jgi:hypothetical protein
MDEAKRKLASWADAFYEFTDRLPTPSLFRKWAAISCIAGALERKVYVMAFPDPLYPNLYTVLTGPPGAGKTFIIAQIRDFWKQLKNHHVARSAMSRAAMLDALKGAERNEIVYNGKGSNVLHFNSLLIPSNELSVLLPAYDSDFMGNLTDLYDCRPYGEKKRTSDLDYEIDRPQLNIVAGTTPSYLNDLMPEGAWDQGFISRVMLVYSGENTKKSLFIPKETSLSLQSELVHDLKIIGKMHGEMKFTSESAAAINNWHMAGGPPTPDHPKLLHYNTRRTAHLLKLCMVASASDSDDLKITIDHYQTALDWLLEMEKFMPDTFKAMSSGGDGKIMKEAWHFTYSMYAREKKPVPAARVYRFISERAPAHSVDRILQVMVNSQVLYETYPKENIGKCYLPGESQEK